MNTDFISTYFPDLNSIDVDVVSAARSRIDTHLRAEFPDLDTRVNSVFGDLVITPYAYMLAAFEESMGRFMSDLDLENVSNGVIYNCFARETEFVTRQGVKSFQDFSPGDVVTVLSAQGRWQPAVVRSFGRQPLKSIHIRRGKLHYHVRATESHRWLLRDGTETTALRTGDILQEAPCLFNPWEYGDALPEERVAWAYGYIFGDGTVLRDSNGKARWSMVRLCGDDKGKFAERFRELGFEESSPQTCKGDVMFYTGQYIKEPLKHEESFEVLQAFCRGYMDADASKNYNRSSSRKRSNKKEYLKIQATGDLHRDFIRSMFPVIGQYITYEHDMSGDCTNMGVRGETSDFGLNNWIYDQAPKFIVEGIQDSTTEEVWCLEVDDDRTFVLPFGLATGNCDFVRKYLNNFAVADRNNLKSSGVVRLTFCEDKDYTIDRRTRYQFGAENEFTLRLPYTGHFIVKETSATLPTGQNTRRLVQVDHERWACDIGVHGVMSSTSLVVKGDAGTTDLVVEDLESIVASVDFELGYPEESLPKLAAKTRQTFYSATMATRNGCKHFLSKEFPELDAISAVVSGDDEQLRSVATPLGIPTGRADVYVKSKEYLTEDTQIFTLAYNVAGTRYVGELNFLNPPCEILSITSASSPTTDLGFGTSDIVILSRSTDFSKAPYLTSAYSTYEEFFIYIDAPTPGLTNTVISGDQFHDFAITYRADSAIRSVSDVVNSPDNAPIAVDMLTRGFVVVRITRLTITYVKKAGVKMLLDTARTEIVNYLQSLGHDKVYSDSRIIDTMFYAGAEDVVSIVPAASVQWTVADQILPEGGTDPVANWTTALTEARPLPVINITTTAGLIPDYQDVDLGVPADETYASAGKRNVCYIIDADDIVFTETLA